MWRIVLGELDTKMGVQIVEESAERVVATLPVEGNRQSFGLLHGGASVAFAEALGSWAAVIHADSLGLSAVGLDINATHHASAREGIVTGVATAIRLGRTVTSHEVVISDDAGRRLCTARITNLMVPRDADQVVRRRARSVRTIPPTATIPSAPISTAMGSAGPVAGSGGAGGGGTSV